MIVSMLRESEPRPQRQKARTDLPIGPADLGTRSGQSARSRNERCHYGKVHSWVRSRDG